MTVEPFHLRDAVRAVLAETSLTNPRDIATKVAEDIPRRAVPAALVEALTVYTRVEMGWERRQAGRPPSAARLANPSSKVAAIREAWRRHLRTRIHVGGGQWSLLGECSRDQVLFAAEERHELARKNAAAAQRFDGLGAAMLDHKVDRVADLPDVVLAELLGDADEVAA